MNVLSELAGFAGGWQGTNTLQDPETRGPDPSAATAVVTPVLGGRFVRLDYTWIYKGAGQEGSILIGCRSKTGELSAQWIDSWHMGEVMMSCRGERTADGAFSLLGSYAAPPGPDWGWRIVIDPTDARKLRLRMFNIMPGGEEEAAVEASYSRIS
jgi:hypothetical protein